MKKLCVFLRCVLYTQPDFVNHSSSRLLYNVSFTVRSNWRSINWPKYDDRYFKIVTSYQTCTELLLILMERFYWQKYMIFKIKKIAYAINMTSSSTAPLDLFTYFYVIISFTYPDLYTSGKFTLINYNMNRCKEEEGQQTNLSESFGSFLMKF